MANVLDTTERTSSENKLKRLINLIVYIYAAILTIILVSLLSGINIKTSPTPLEADDPTEIHASYSRLACICINVGECGNDQVVLGLESNTVSKKFYQFLVWKSSGQ